MDMSNTSTSNPVETTGALFTREEIPALQALRVRYHVDHDQFSDRERARLHFFRWLYETGPSASTHEKWADGRLANTGAKR